MWVRKDLIAALSAVWFVGREGLFHISTASRHPGTHKLKVGVCVRGWGVCVCRGWGGHMAGWLGMAQPN